MPVRPRELYQPKTADGDMSGMIRIRSAGDFLSGSLPTKGCCGLQTGWAEYSARLKIPMGFLTADVIESIARISREYGRGEVYLTARLGMEIPGIQEEDFSVVEEELAKVGVKLAGCGPRMRSVMACKGTVCVHGNIDTFLIAWEIDKRFNDGSPMPHKFKVGVAGCASTCSKPRLNDVGLIGVYEPYVDINNCKGCNLCANACHLRAIRIEDNVAVIDKDICVNCGDCAMACLDSAMKPLNTGIDLYVGGRWGREKQVGIGIALFLTQGEAVEVVGQIKKWYRDNGNENERLGKAMLRMGINLFQKAVLHGINKDKWIDIKPE